MDKIRNLWRRFGRSVVAVGIAGGTLLASALTDGHVDQAERLQIGIAVATAAGVWLVPNLPNSAGIKTALAALLAVLNLATTLNTGGITAAEWVNLALAAAGVLGVGVAPSRSSADQLVPRAVASLRVPPEAAAPRW